MCDIITPKKEKISEDCMEYTYIDRIKSIKNQKKITNDALSEITGIPLGTLSKILAGISDSPKLSNIVAICDALDCSLDYILTGIPENTNNYTLEESEMTLIENYRKLDKHSRDLVRLVINKEAERASEHTDTFARKAGTQGRGAVILGRESMQRSAGLGKRKIDLFDLPVSAGTGVFLSDTEAVTISIPSTSQTESADFALRIKGNSMEPKYRDGDILLVEECDTVEYGELGIFILDGEGYFKKYEGDRLVSLNPDYAPIMLRNFEDVSCRGKVIGKLKRK